MYVSPKCVCVYISPTNSSLLFLVLFPLGNSNASKHLLVLIHFFFAKNKLSWLFSKSQRETDASPSFTLQMSTSNRGGSGQSPNQEFKCSSSMWTPKAQLLEPEPLLPRMQPNRKLEIDAKLGLKPKCSGMGWRNFKQCLINHCKNISSLFSFFLLNPQLK